MKSPMSWIVLSVLLFLLAGAAWQGAFGADLAALPQRVHAGSLMLSGIGVLFGLICWGVYSEDAATRREAASCRERSACSSADLALAESDLLLGRLGAPAPGSDAGTQLALIRTELGQLQRQSAVDDPLLAARVELLCARVDRVCAVVSERRQALDPG